MARPLGGGLRPGGLISFLIDLETTPRRRVTDTAHACWTPNVLGDESLENSASGEIFRCEGSKRTAETFDHERAVARAYLWNSTENFQKPGRRIDALFHRAGCFGISFR